MRLRCGAPGVKSSLGNVCERDSARVRARLLRSSALAYHSRMRAEALELIWRTVVAIPRGEIATYGGIARRAGLPGRARMVGHALKVAPRALALPWHRVVAAGGRIAFPKGSRQYAEQATPAARRGRRRRTRTRQPQRRT
jgi:O-6-methylguanine DNA methyltransferase